MGLIFNEKVVEKCNSVDKSTITGWKKKEKKKRKKNADYKTQTPL